MNSLGAFEKVPCKYDKSSEADRARLRKVFDMYDRNKDGSIDLEEVREALAPLAVADGAVLRVLKRLDKDGDNKISFDEFEAHLQAPNATFCIAIAQIVAQTCG